MRNEVAVWDVINEGGEGYRPACAQRSDRTVAQRAPGAVDRMLRDAQNRCVPASKVAARLARDQARMLTLTDATAIAIVQESIDADRALLGL